MKKKYPEYILKYLRQREDLCEFDTSMDDIFNKMSPNEVFEETCKWNGFLGNYHEIIKGWVCDIYNIKLQ